MKMAVLFRNTLLDIQYQWQLTFQIRTLHVHRSLGAEETTAHTVRWMEVHRVIGLLVLADDLTGALDSGVQLARKGDRVAVTTELSMDASLLDGHDVLVIDTETRHVTSDEAYHTIYGLVATARDRGVGRIYKKCDSGLRGNVGAEIAAALDASGRDHIDFVPAYPKLGRVTRHLVQYVDGKPLAQSIFADDPTNPVTQSRIDDLIHLESDVAVSLHDGDAFVPGVDVFDCDSDADLVRIGMSLAETDGLVLVAGCAGLLETYPRQSAGPSEARSCAGLKARLSVLSGSVNAVTRSQLDYAEAHGAPRMHLPLAPVLSGSWCERDAARLAGDFARAATGTPLALLDTLDFCEATLFERHAHPSRAINQAMGLIAREVLEEDDRTLMVIGGDTLASLMTAMGIRTLEPVEEILPGVVLARFEDAGRERCLITKSGAFGADDLLMQVQQYLVEKQEVSAMSVDAYSLKLPHAVYSGADSLGRIPDILKGAGATKVAAFTDRSIRSLGLFDLVATQVEAAGLACEVFDDLTSEPSYEAAQATVDEFRSTGADFIIACGGGSVMDAAKLASVLDTDEYGVKDLLGDPGRARKCAPLLAIPTTAGTGAECTPNAIVAVPERETKIGIVNDSMVPDYVVLDAEMIRNLPRKIAATTGVDAMAHCIECFTSKKSNPFSDTFALEGFDIIMNNIMRACDDADALAEKNQMQIGAFYGGIAITASGTTSVHGLAYPLGGKYHMAHGVSIAMMLAPCLEFNEPACRHKFAQAWDRAYHGDTVLATEEEKSRALLAWIGDIVRDLDIPTDLREFGVKPEDLDGLVEAGMQQQRLLVNNMREVTADDARAIYERLLS